MKIEWLAHASFLVTSKNNLKLVTDPYHNGPGFHYRPINETADIVTKSHDHGDHSNTGAVKGNPEIVDKAGAQTVKGLVIKGIPTFHDEAKGSKRGINLIFCFTMDDITVCHLGDLGHLLDPKQLADLGAVDVLIIPVGGYFTIDAKEATAVTQSIKPKLVFPMHYKTAKTDLPIHPIDEFLIGKTKIQKVNSSEYELTKETLPEETEIIVLQPANF
jgi:L-ascorbate metabolism protein UlaG (beta-lactamase superfamily)